MAKKNGKPQDKVKEFHSNLKQAGFSENEIGTADQFKGAFETQEKASKFYDNLVGTEKVSEKEIGTKEQFLSTFQDNFKKKAESEPTSPTSEKPSQPSGRQLSDGLSDITGQESGLPTDKDLFGQTQEQPQQVGDGGIAAPDQPKSINVSIDEPKIEINGEVKESLSGKLKEAYERIEQDFDKEQQDDVKQKLANNIMSSVQNVDPLLAKEKPKEIEQAVKQELESEPMRDVDFGVEDQAKAGGEDKGAWSDIYKSFQRGSARIGEGIARLPSLVYDVAALPQNVIGEATGYEEMIVESPEWLDDNPVAEFYEKSQKNLSKQITQYDKGINSYLASGDYGKALRVGGNAMAESLPYTLAMMAGGAAGMGSAGLTLPTTGIFGSVKKRELDEKTEEQAEQGVDTLTGKRNPTEQPDMSEATKTWNALLTGASEGVMESLGSAKIGSELIKRFGQKKGKKLLKKGFKRSAYNVLKELGFTGKSGIREGLTEASTKFSENVTARTTGEDPERNIFEGVDDAFTIGFGMGAGLSGAGQTASNIVKREGKEKTAKIDGKEVSHDEVAERLEDPVFVQEAKNNGVDLEVNNPDPALEQKLENEFDPTQDNLKPPTQKVESESEESIKIDGQEATEEQLSEKLEENGFVEAVKNGIVDLEVKSNKDDLINKVEQKFPRENIPEQETEAEQVELTTEEQKVAEDVGQDSEVADAEIGQREELISRKYNVDPERATAIAQKAFGEQTTGGEDAVQEQQTEEVDVRQQAGDGETVVEGGEAQTQQQQEQAQEETQEAEVAEQETQEQLDAQTVEAINAEVSEVEGIAQSISQLKEQNQQHFKKNGEPRKNAPQEVKDEYERLTNEYTERASQVQSNVEQRVKELEDQERELSEQETQEINRQFEEKQQEFIDKYGLSEDEVLEQSAEQKIEQGLTLTQKELEYANENFYKPEGYQFNERGELISETEQTEEVSETVKPPEETEVTQPSVELQEKDDFAQDAGFENLDQAVNSVRKNLDKEVDRESITFEDIQSAAQQSESIQAVQDQSEEQLVEEANEKLDQIEEGKSPAQLEVGGQKITQVINNLSPDNRSKVINKYQDKQQQYQKQQEKLAEQKDEVAQAKESLNEAFNKWLEGNQGVGIANDPKQRAKEDVELMNALKNYAQALAARGVKNFNEFVKELPAKLKENLTNANLKEAWDEGKQGVKKGTQKGAKQQTREATGQKKDDNVITINERDALKQQIKDAERGRKEGKLDEQKARENLVEGIRETIKGMEGKLTPSKINTLLKKVTSVNLSKPDKVNKLLAYVDNLVEDSNNKVYESRLNEFLKKIHPNKFKEQRVSGIPKGKIDNEARKQLRQIHDAAKNKTIDQINEELDQLRAKLEDGQDVTREMESLIIAKKAKQGLQEMNEAENMAKDLVKVGKSSLQEKLNEKHKEYQEIKKQALDAVSEGKGVLTGFEKKKRNAETRTWLSNLVGGFNGFLDKIEGLRTLLDKIDRSKKTEAGGFGGVLDNILYKKIAKSRQKENEFNQKDQELLYQKLKEIYGSKKALRKAMNENSQEQEVGTFTDLNGNEVTITLSQNQAYYLYNLMKAEENMDTFVDMGWTDEMMDAVKNFLTPEVKKWADWQVDEFYPMIYDRVNSVYKKMNYIDLKAHENYTPIRRENVEQGADEEIGTFKNNLVDASYGSLKERTASKAPFDVSVDGDAMLMKHMAGMNHYAAFAESVKDMSVIVGDKNIREAIRQNNNKDVVSVLESFHKDIARGGVDKAKVIGQLEFLRTHVATATLGLNPTIYVKQLTSTVAYMSNIPSGDFLKGMGEFAANPRKAIRILNESDYIKNRYTEGFDRDMADAMARDYKEKLGGKQNWKSRMMFLVKWGDKGAIVAGGYSIYRHHYKKAKRKGMGDQEAHLNALYEFEEATKLSQQSTNVEDLSEFQRGGTFAKLFTMYMTSPIAYFRQERKSVRDLVRGGNRKDAAKRFAIYHFAVPAMFQYIASGLPGLMSEWDEEDTKDLTRAMTIGSLNGIFLFGQLLEFGGDYITGKPWAELGEFEPIPAMSQVTSVVKGLGDVVKESAEGELDQDMFDAIMEASTASIDIGTGIPASRLQKFYENYQLILGERNTTVSEDVLLAGGYSPYIVLGSEYKAYIPNLERDVIKGLKKKDVTVSEPQQPKGVSKDKYQDYVAEFNRLMSKKVNDNWEELKDKPKKELDKIIRDYRGEAREHAKNAAGIKSKKKGEGVQMPGAGSGLGTEGIDTEIQN